MGQGTDSCGGYDVEYDPYDDGLDSGLWVQADGSEIHISKMSFRHLRNAKKRCERLAVSAQFPDQWEQWIELFDDEIFSRKAGARASTKKTTPSVRGSTVTMVCHCGIEYPARTADIKRGWGLSCSKSCAAIRRDFDRPKAKKKVTS